MEGAASSLVQIRRSARRSTRWVALQIRAAGEKGMTVIRNHSNHAFHSHTLRNVPVKYKTEGSSCCDFGECRRRRSRHGRCSRRSPAMEEAHLHVGPGEQRVQCLPIFVLRRSHCFCIRLED